MTPDAAAPPTALTPADALPSIDLRLIAVDMDGTLLDANGAVPDDLWPLLDDLHDRGIAFAPASGRQYATLRRDFDSHADGMVFIAENGALIDGEPVSKDFPFVNVERLRDFTKVSAGKKRHALVKLSQPA